MKGRIALEVKFIIVILTFILEITFNTEKHKRPYTQMEKYKQQLALEKIA